MVDGVNGTPIPQQQIAKGADNSVQAADNPKKQSGDTVSVSIGSTAKQDATKTVLTGVVQSSQSSNTTQSKIKLLEAQARSKKTSAQSANGEDAQKLRREAEEIDKQVKSLKSKQSLNKKV